MFLTAHPDPIFVDYLLTGLSQGFRVGVLSPPTGTFIARNLQSALNEPLVTSDLLAKEVAKGYVVGPFPAPPFRPFRVNALGVATRKYMSRFLTCPPLMQPLGLALMS